MSMRCPLAIHYSPLCRHQPAVLFYQHSVGVSAYSLIFITLQLSVDGLDVSVATISYIPASSIVCEIVMLGSSDCGKALSAKYSPVSNQFLDCNA